jgi:hypothetical protein
MIRSPWITLNQTATVELLRRHHDRNLPRSGFVPRPLPEIATGRQLEEQQTKPAPDARGQLQPPRGRHVGRCALDHEDGIGEARRAQHLLHRP